MDQFSLLFYSAFVFIYNHFIHHHQFIWPYMKSPQLETSLRAKFLVVIIFHKYQNLSQMDPFPTLCKST